MNFSWIEDDKLAGCRGIRTDEELGFVASLGIKGLVRLAPHSEIDIEPAHIEGAGIVDFPEPVSDWTAPTQEQIRRVLAFTANMVRTEKPVAISCGWGRGRTGTILTCYLIQQGLSADEAIDAVRQKGRTAYETTGQLEAIKEYERSL